MVGLPVAPRCFARSNDAATRSFPSLPSAHFAIVSGARPIFLAHPDQLVSTSRPAVRVGVARRSMAHMPSIPAAADASNPPESLMTYLMACSTTYHSERPAATRGIIDPNRMAPRDPDELSTILRPKIGDAAI